MQLLFMTENKYICNTASSIKANNPPVLFARRRSTLEH